jgi:hypothetical protein
MRIFWRSEAMPLRSYLAWLGHVDAKNREAGTSAPTLATSWSGPVDLLGALATHPSLGDLSVLSAAVEAKSTFDAYGGNVRNHDLLLRAVTADGERVVVCVEAKAGEPLGATVAEQARSAEKARAANPNSNASARLADLQRRLCRHSLDDPEVAKLRYQLLTAWAGTLAEASEAAHAVLVLHEFRTDQRPEDKSVANDAELARFADVVLGCQLPDHDAIPWCVDVPRVANLDAQLYVAHVVTDLRSATIGNTTA